MTSVTGGSSTTEHSIVLITSDRPRVIKGTQIFTRSDFYPPWHKLYLYVGSVCLPPNVSKFTPREKRIYCFGWDFNLTDLLGSGAVNMVFFGNPCETGVVLDA